MTLTHPAPTLLPGLLPDPTLLAGPLAAASIAGYRG